MEGCRFSRALEKFHLNERENMQAIVATSDTDLHSRVNHQISRLFNFGKLMSILLPVLLICVLVSMVSGQSNVQTTSQPANAAPVQSDARKAFEKLKTLEGSWQGTIMSIPINLTIRVASSGTAILHEANTDGGRPPSHEITMFYVEGDRLLATHYCDGGNRARFEGKISPDGKAIEFSFLEVTGSTKGGLVKHMVFTTVDANKHVIEFTFIMPNGNPIELRGDFERTK
jgi:hypothetical protein